ncbi:hypothetical protein OG470_21685 [Micromonospora sp. NBC_00389]|uniref:hypothetical protein n=1 Tax=Micromonospora sp. NBC_00389 TaxID=2903586 RepID=UPI002E244AA9
MRLIDLVERLDQLPDEATIYAGRPWSPEARAEAVVDDENQRPDYLLEVSLAREVLEVWSAWRGGRTPSPAEACAAVIHYAEWDAYLPVEE